VTVDRQGNIIVAGATQGALPGQTLGGDWDAYLKKLSPAGAELWTHQFTNSVSVGVLAVTVDGTGNIIAVGHTVGPLPGQTGAGVDDAYVRKLSPAGMELWTQQFGSPAGEWAFGVAVDASGNIIVVGATDGAFPGQTNAGYEDAWVRKLSPAGAELWTRQFGSPRPEGASGVAVDGAGSIIVAGYTDGTMPGQSKAGGRDVLVRKFSAAGVELWTRQFGSPNPDEALAVAVDGAGNIIVAGSTVVPDYSAPENVLEFGMLPGETPPGHSDAFVWKLSPAGVELWASQFGSPRSDEALAVAVDGTGSIIVAGVVGSGYDALDDVLPGQTAAGGADAFVRKLSPAGVELWTSQFGSSFDDRALGVAVDGIGDIIAVGYTEGALPGQTAAGAGDAFVRKFSAAGVELWTSQFGSSAADGASGVAVDGTGSVIAAGDTFGALPGQTSAAGDDAFVRKFSAAGVELWTSQFGSAAWVAASGVAVDGAGFAIAVGGTNGALPGQTNLGSWDAFVVRLSQPLAP
jgi:hypothetical protein